MTICCTVHLCGCCVCCTYWHSVRYYHYFTFSC